MTDGMTAKGLGRWRRGLGYGLAVLAMLPGGAAAQALPQSLPPQVTPSVIGAGSRPAEERTEPPPVQDEPLVGGQGLNGLPRITIRGGGIRFTLTGVDFDPSSLLPAEELAKVESGYAGRSVTFADLQELVAEVNRLYDAHGQSAARAVLPAQRIDGGRVRIQLVEGRVESIAVQGDPVVGDRYVRDRIRAASGQVLDTRELHRDVLRFNLTNEAQLRAALQPGASFGLTDLQLAVFEPPRTALDLSADNYGFEATGRGQGAAMFRTGSLIVPGDRTTVYAAGSQGTRVGNLAYNLPVGTGGGRVGFGLSGSWTEVVKGDYRHYGITGTSRSASLTGSHPLWTGDSAQLSLTAALAHSLSSNSIAGTRLSGTRTTRGMAGLSFYYGDEGTSVMASQAVGLARMTETTGGQTRNAPLFTGDLNAFHRLSEEWAVQLRGAWQLSTLRELSGDQLFQIGGAASLRALPPGALTGDDGVFGQAELHWDAATLVEGTPLRSLDLYGFYESGLIRLTGGRRAVMSDAGVGAAARLSDLVSLEATVAARLRDGDAAPMDRYRLYVRTVFHVF